MILEAIADDGVRLNPFRTYVAGYNGNIAIARRPKLSQSDHETEMRLGLEVLSDPYNFSEEVCSFAHKLLPFIGVHPSVKEFYCSAVMEYISLAGPYPLSHTRAGDAWPEDLWIHPSVEAVGALILKPA